MQVVGIMTNFNKPTRLAEITAHISKSYNIDIVYLRPKDVNMKRDKVKGKFLVNNVWIEKEIDIPPIIDIVPYCFKKENKNITDYLKGKTFLTDNRTNVLSKQQLQEALKEDNNFSHLVIPTHHLNDFNQMLDCLNKYSKIVLKPMKGIRGRGVYVLEKKSDLFTLGYKKQIKKMNHKELESFFEESLVNKSYIIQKHINSRTIQDDPFDCRVHVEKNGNGEWQSAKNYIRIGIGQKVISNVNQGGGISEPEAFLKSNFGDKWKEINGKLEEIAVTLPYKVEKLRSTHIMSLGMDIGIDQDGKLYLFEVNDGPSTGTLISEVALLRSNYYKYLFENKIITRSMKPPSNEVLQKNDYKDVERELDLYKEKYNKLLKEKDYYKKKYTSIEKGASWIVKKLIRIIGSIKKNKL